VPPPLRLDLSLQVRLLLLQLSHHLLLHALHLCLLGLERPQLLLVLSPQLLAPLFLLGSLRLELLLLLRLPLGLLLEKLLGVCCRWWPLPLQLRLPEDQYLLAADLDLDVIMPLGTGNVGLRDVGDDFVVVLRFPVALHKPGGLPPSEERLLGNALETALAAPSPYQRDLVGHVVPGARHVAGIPHVDAGGGLWHA